MFVSQALALHGERAGERGVNQENPYKKKEGRKSRSSKTPALQTALLSRLLLDGFLDGLLRGLLDGLLLLSGQSTSPPSSGTKRYSRTTHFQRGEPGLHRTPALTSYETKKK